MSLKSYKTTDYMVGVDVSVDSIDMDLSESEHARGSQKPSAPKEYCPPNLRCKLNLG